MLFLKCVFLLVPGISSSKAATVGLGAVQVGHYAQTICEYKNIKIVNSALIDNFLFQVVMTAVATWLVDKTGRRVLLIVCITV